MTIDAHERVRAASAIALARRVARLRDDGRLRAVEAPTRSSRSTARCTRSTSRSTRNVVRPVAQAYVDYVPRRSAPACRNFFGNIDDLFSGDQRRCCRASATRPATISAASSSTPSGFGGLIDIASRGGIPKGNEDFGQTFGYWGIPRARTCSSRCSGRRRCATAPGWSSAYYSSPISYIVNDVPLRNVLYCIGCARPARAGARRADDWSTRRRSTATRSSAAPTCSGASTWSTTASRPGRTTTNDDRSRRRIAVSRSDLPPGATFAALRLLAAARCRAARARAGGARCAGQARRRRRCCRSIKTDPKVQAGDQARIRELIETKLAPNFDFARMTSLAMGRNWRKATPEQQKRLADEFQTLLVRTYSSALNQYRDQRSTTSRCGRSRPRPTSSCAPRSSGPASRRCRSTTA